MSEGEHLLYFSSKYSPQDSITGRFIINLPLTLNLEGEWKCALLDFFIRPDNSDDLSSEFIYILGDFCKTSFIQQNKQLPILKKVSINNSAHQYEFSYPLYIPLKQSSLTNFTLTFLDTFLKPIILHKSYLIECTLHFTKYGG